MKRWLKNNSLSVVVFGLFFVFLISQSVTGYWHYNEEQQVHGESRITYGQYVVSGDFIESVFENWESEFLQMGMYVILTVFLLQQGSAESKKIHSGSASDRKPQKSVSKDAPWPVRQGGWVLKVYENSLSIAFLLLFLLSFWLHAYGGAQVACEESIGHAERMCQSTLGYVTTSRFWFESFQNWQSEFLAVGSIVILSVYLRQKGSPESKPVNTPHGLTGSE